MKKTIIVVMYERDGKIYSHVLPNMINDMVEVAMLKIGIVKRQIKNWYRKQIPAGYSA